MKKLAFLGGAAGLGILAFLAVPRGHAADHLDSPVAVASPMADLNDLYAWMEGTNLNLAMSVSPADVDARAFGPEVQYVFHVHSKPMRQSGKGMETQVVCTFASSTSAQCWVVQGNATKDYATGDPTSTGIRSESGKLRVFAGRRSDPFFFNLQGFRAATAAIRTRFGMAPAVQLNVSGCPTNLTNTEIRSFVQPLDAPLTNEPPCAGTGRDCFDGLNVRMIVVQLDKSLVNANTNQIGVWASTHATP